MQYKKFKEYSISTLGLGGLRFPTKKNNPNSIDREERLVLPVWIFPY